MSKSLRKLNLITVLVLITALLFGACSSGGTTPASTNSGSKAESVSESSAKPDPAVKSSKILSVYTAFTEDEAEFMFRKFEEETGIQVKGIRMSAGELYARVKAESANPQASVWFCSTFDTFSLAKDDGLLEPYRVATIDEFPDFLRESEDYFTPICLNVLGFASNQTYLDDNGLEAPTSWKDALKPEFKNNVVIAHPATSGMAYSWLCDIVTLYGEEEGFDYMKQVNSQLLQCSKSGVAPARMVGLGETAISFCFASAAMQSAAEGYPVAVTFPEEGTGAPVDYMALIKNGPADELENAKMFLDWSARADVQSAFSAFGYRLPANTNAEVPDGLVKLEEIKLLDIDGDYYAENRERLLERFENEVRGADTVTE